MQLSAFTSPASAHFPGYQAPPGSAHHRSRLAARRGFYVAPVRTRRFPLNSQYVKRVPSPERQSSPPWATQHSQYFLRPSAHGACGGAGGARFEEHGAPSLGSESLSRYSSFYSVSPAMSSCCGCVGVAGAEGVLDGSDSPGARIQRAAAKRRLQGLGRRAGAGARATAAGVAAM